MDMGRLSTLARSSSHSAVVVESLDFLSCLSTIMPWCYFCCSSMAHALQGLGTEVGAGHRGACVMTAAGLNVSIFTHLEKGELCILETYLPEGGEVTPGNGMAPGMSCSILSSSAP